MKRFVLLFIIISLAWTVSLVSCVNNSLPIPDTEITDTPHIIDTSTPPQDTSDVTEIINIVDLTLSGDILTADALEGFYTDGTHDYYFPSIKSQYIIVEFSDGTTMNVKEAFEQELITIADLDRFNIGYFVEIKDNGMEVVSITDRTVAEMIPTDSALELFWQDEFCDYYFPSIRSEYVVVELLNGDSYYVKDALENGIITIKDLDKYNIQYTTVKAREPEADECALEGLKLIDESDENTSPYASLFYSDEEYMYFYPNGAYEVELLYTNGYSESLYSALERGTVTFDEIDASSVEYFKVAHTEFGKCGVREVVDLEELGFMKNEFPGGMYDDTFAPIYEDDAFYYVLHTPYEAAVIVVYNDNTTERIKDALAAGRAKISDLETSGIPFDAIPKCTGKIGLTNYNVKIFDEVPVVYYTNEQDNFSEFAEYSVSLPGGHVLLIDFSTYKRFNKFIEAERNRYDFDKFYANRDAHLNDYIEVYTEEWFKTNDLILLDLRQPNLPAVTEVKDISLIAHDNGRTTLSINSLFIDGPATLEASTYIFIEINKAYLQSCDGFEITYDKEDFYAIGDIVKPQNTVEGIGEKFHEDEEYEYYFGYFSYDPLDVTYVRYDFVTEGFGLCEYVDEAFDMERVTLSDLDEHGIDYIKIPKNTPDIVPIDHTVSGDMIFMWGSDAKPNELFDLSVKMNQSLYGNMTCFSDFEEFSLFIATVKENIIYYHELFDTWNEESIDELISEYTREWFESYSLIVIHYSQGHYIENRDITVSLEKFAVSGGGNIVTVRMETPNFGADLGVDWLVCVEIEREDVNNCSEYRLIIEEIN